MKKIMKEIFNAHNFQITNIPTAQDIDMFYAASENSDKANYYLVLFVDDLFDSKKNKVNFNDFYEDIIQVVEEYDHQMDKNLSMVICAKRNTLNQDEELSRVIYQVEEDPYIFKKNVLTYTDKQVKMIYQMISANGTLIDLFYKILYDHDDFLLFKSDPYKETVYSFVSKLFIKLPFLKLKNKEQRIENISENIDKSLNDNQIKLREKTLKYTKGFKGTPAEVREKVLDFLEVDEL